ncbi:alpha/beta hydrolase, partial [Halobacillus sp. BBL2006]|uniref:alpha/beta hydrolase n=1 Tax=Halobacillus sp. BBL2006 TaxID=1543706 RepID=UPI000542288E
MFTYAGAKLLRYFSNQSKKTPMLSMEPVSAKKDIMIETSVKQTMISCYYPLQADTKRFPVYMNLHGGAFIMNSKEMDDPYCRYLANQTGCVVINVDYAKAPEYSFPKPIEQSYEILHWIKENADELNIDPEKITVGGQSSGANIMAALC